MLVYQKRYYLLNLKDYLRSKEGEFIGLFNGELAEESLGELLGAFEELINGLLGGVFHGTLVGVFVREIFGVIVAH